MAIGDRIPTEMIAPQVLNAAASAYFTNAGASYRGQLTGLWLCNTGASKRTVTIFKNGTGAANQIATVVLGSVGDSSLASSAFIDLSGKALVFTGAQTLSAKQDAGTDVTIAGYGIVEQIA